MKRLCSICARGGSKGVPGKNIREMHGRPLIAHTVIQAKKSDLFTAIAISSDSDDILSAAKDAGADILIKRPDELATDQAGKIPVIRHCAIEAEKQLGIVHDLFFDLDVTSPLRHVSDIYNAVELMERTGAENMFSVTPADHSPYFNMVECDDKGVPTLSKDLIVPVVRRQDAPKVFDINGSIYGWKRDVLMTSDSLYQATTQVYEMPRERSIDIDVEIDFKFVELLMQAG